MGGCCFSQHSEATLSGTFWVFSLNSTGKNSKRVSTYYFINKWVVPLPPLLCIKDRRTAQASNRSLGLISYNLFYAFSNGIVYLIYVFKDVVYLLCSCIKRCFSPCYLFAKFTNRCSKKNPIKTKWWLQFFFSPETQNWLTS